MTKLVFVFFFFISEITNARPGFYPLHSKDIPEEIRKKARSVYRVVDLNQTKIVIKKEKYKQKISSCSVEGGFLCQQIVASLKKCYAENLLSCNIPISGIGTGFLVGNGKEILTTRHSFDPSIRKALKTKDSGQLCREGMEVEIQLYDFQDRIVFDSTHGADQASLGCPETSELTGKKLGALTGSTDVLRIRLNRTLASTPLVWAESANHFEKIYIPGFPTKTVGRSKLCGAPESNGRGMKVSMGKIVAPQESGIEQLNHFTKDSLKKMDGVFSFFDADAVEGMSGAPVLNEQGQIVAMLTNYFEFNDSKDPKENCTDWGSYGVNAIQAKKLISQ